MTVANTPRSAGPYPGTGVTSVFTFAFKVFLMTDVLVQIVTAAGALTVGTLGTDYSVSLNADQNGNPGGMVITTVPLPGGATLAIGSQVPLDQEVVLTNPGGFYPQVISDALDKVTILIQQALQSIAGAIRIPEIGSSAQILPPAAQRANQLLSFDSSGNPVVVAPVLGTATALALNLASTASASAGAGQIGLNQTLIYNVGTAGQHLVDLPLNPRDLPYQAKFDNITDDTVAIQLAINSLVGPVDAFDGITPALVIQFPRKSKVYIAGTIYLPSFVRLDLNGSTLRGSGTNTCFESGYWTGGAVVSNFGQPNETKFANGAQVYNGQLLNFNIGFRLFNFCEDSLLDNLRMIGVNQAVYAKRCFYGSFTRIMSRSPLNGTLLPCFHFDDSVNAVNLDTVFTVGYTVGWQFSGSKDNVYAQNCGAETCTTGLNVLNTTSGMQIRGWYFEGTTDAIKFSNAANHENVYVTGCWFNSTTNAINGQTVVSGEFSANNKLNGAVILLSTNFSNRMRVGIPTDLTADNAVAALPAGYTLGDANLVDYIKTLYNSGSGLVNIKGRVHGGVVPHCYSGGSGTPSGNVIPFCTSTLLPASLTINTSISFLATEFVGVQITITDGTPQVIAGIIAAAGTFLSLSKPGPLTVTATNNGGLYRITVTGLTAATAFAGVVRIL